MKRNSVLTVILAAGLSVPLFAHAALQCIMDETIDTMNFGYVENYAGTPDDGHAMVVRFSGGKAIPLNYRFNANDDAGKSMISALRMAFSLRLKVSVWDHFSSNCDDFDQVLVKRD